MFRTLIVLPLFAVLLPACNSAYYAAMEKVGFEKRDILVDRVEDARDAQEDAQEQFTSALEQFSALVDFDGGDLQELYESLSDEYEDSRDAAARVSERIDRIEDVGNDLFTEWAEELEEYSSDRLRRDSERKLRDTQGRYENVLSAMRRAEGRMDPVLDALQDNVLYLKHNLNASAIGALQGELGDIRGEVDRLIAEMNSAIAESNEFIASLQ